MNTANIELPRQGLSADMNPGGEASNKTEKSPLLPLVLLGLWIVNIGLFLAEFVSQGSGFLPR